MMQTYILIVDADILVRNPIASYLRECGYRVVEAASANEAVDYVLGQDPIDLVFSDVRMPGSMDGLELAVWLIEVRPGVKILLTSGHLDANLAVGIVPLIPKPYRIADVISKFRAYLGLEEDFQ